MSRLLDTAEITRQLEDLTGWTYADKSITATASMPTFPEAISLVDRTAVDAEEMNHHPDMDIRWRSVHFLLTTHDAGGLTQLDIELAHRISTYVTEGKGAFATA